MNRPVVRGIELFLIFFFGIHKNRRHLPEEQCILISNHNSPLDTFVLASLFTGKHRASVRVVAAKDSFGKGIQGWLAKWILQIVLVERHVQGLQNPLEETSRLLREKFSLIIYPEGTRGEPGMMVPFKRGIGVLATQFPDIPIFPVFIQGVEKCLARNDHILVPFEIGIRVSDEPFYGRDHIKEGKNLHEVSSQITQSLESRVRSLGT